MSASVTNGGYYLKVKQVATVEADQDVVIKAGTVRQISSGTTDFGAVIVIPRMQRGRDRSSPMGPWLPLIRGL
jgi:hypothetical protein